MIRSPYVAGRFYPARPELLTEDVRRYTAVPQAKLRATGCIVPHAGYRYSGGVAGAVYAALDLPARFVILCPNHSGFGAPMAVMSSGEWLTPLGAARIDEELAARLKQACPALEEDSEAHAREHSLEVQLPFLQHLAPGFRFVPIAIGRGDYRSLEALGQALAGALREDGERVLLVASSDMNHYERDEITRAKDQRAIDAILALDTRRLYEVLLADSNTMCGYGPVLAMLTAARELGARQATLIRYATSADAGGPCSSVVGYAGIVVHEGN